jgi:hypothetical protein
LDRRGFRSRVVHRNGVACCRAHAPILRPAISGREAYAWEFLDENTPGSRGSRPQERSGGSPRVGLRIGRSTALPEASGRGRPVDEFGVRVSAGCGGSRFVVATLPQPPLSERFFSLCAGLLRSGPLGGALRSTHSLRMSITGRSSGDGWIASWS